MPSLRYLILCAAVSLGMCGRLHADEPKPDDITQAIHRAMKFLEHKEGTGNSQYGDYVVFCGKSVAEHFPDYKLLWETYAAWIVEKDVFKTEELYYAACHVMALDVLGKKERVADIFSQMKPFANGGKWKVPYHAAWYLYASVAAGDALLAESTFDYVSQLAERGNVEHVYFLAYCLEKAYQRTRDEKYRRLFLDCAARMKDQKETYYAMAKKDGHAGAALQVCCVAYGITREEEYRQMATRLAAELLASQATNGSWNGLTAYTIMPAEGLTAYLKLKP